jgi:hypothetical protein
MTFFTGDNYMKQKIALTAILFAGIWGSAAQAELTVTAVDASAPQDSFPPAADCEPGPSWDFGSLADFGIIGFDGPLTSVGSGPVPPGFMPDGISIDSQLDGPGGDSRGAGGQGLVGIGPSAGFGNPSNAVGANFFVDALGIDFGEEVCAFEWQASSLLGGPGYDLYVDGAFLASLDNDVRYILSGAGFFEVALYDLSGGAESIYGDALVSLPVPEIEVAIDIKPGSDRNPINLKSKGVIPVAILGSDEFDVTTVDVTTLAFGPAGAPPAHDLTEPGTYVGHLEDVNGDGLLDLVAHFHTQETGLMNGDTEATLTGANWDGVPIFGTDSVDTGPGQ